MRQRLPLLALLTAAVLAGTALATTAAAAPELPAPPAVTSVTSVTAVTATPPPAPVRLPDVAPPLETAFAVADGVVRRTLAFGPDGLQQTLDVYTAAGPPVPRPTVLLVHGGSWQLGDSGEWAGEAVELVRTRGWTAVALNYRLSPQHVWPAAADDASAALRLLAARAPELSVDRARIGAVGDSAGGQLAALLGEPAPGRPSLRSVVTWSGLNDLTGLTRQPSSGGCAGAGPCAYAGLAAKVVRDLMGCAPAECAAEYRAASPSARVSPAHAATLALSSAGEQVDPRQAWVMDAALARAHVPSRVEVLPGALHGRGYQALAWPASLRFLAATLTPETAAAYPRPAVLATLDLPARSRVPAGSPVRLRGVVRPARPGSSVALQVRQPDGSWRTARTARLRSGPTGTAYDLAWTATRGTTTWRALWRGGGALSTTTPRTVVVP